MPSLNRDVQEASNARNKKRWMKLDHHILAKKEVEIEVSKSWNKLKELNNMPRDIIAYSKKEKYLKILYSKRKGFNIYKWYL